MTWHLIPLRAATLLDTSDDRIRYCLARVDVWQRAAGALGLSMTRATPGSTTWVDGEMVRFQQLARPGQNRLRSSIKRSVFGGQSWLGQITVTDGLPVMTIRTGPAAGGRIRFVLGPTGAGTIVTVELVSTDGESAPVEDGSWSKAVTDRALALAQTPRRPAAVLALRTLLGVLTLAVHENSVVVGAAIIRDGRVLAARRTYPAQHAGKWELPGGKVEPGESDSGALIREVREELGIGIQVGEQIGPDVALDVELVLRIYAASIESGEAVAGEHDSLQWVGLADWDQIDWLDGDRALLDYLALVLEQ